MRLPGLFIKPTNQRPMGYQEEKQHQLDLRYLRMARIWAENSYCVRRKVGALIVKDKMIISDGYNGTPSGFENICEDETGKTKSYVLHAEANRQQLRRFDPLHHRRTLHRVFEAHHPGRNPPCGLFGRLPLGRGTRPPAPRGNRMRAVQIRRNRIDPVPLILKKPCGAFSFVRRRILPTGVANPEDMSYLVRRKPKTCSP